jgi:hypothetical protein
VIIQMRGAKELRPHGLGGEKKNENRRDQKDGRGGD